MAQPNTAQTKFMEGTKTEANGFPENYVNKIFIDTDPKADNAGDIDLDDVTTGKWAWLAGGITTTTPSANETTSTDYYYDGGGEGSTDVTGKNIRLAISGSRKLGNPAQNYVAGKFWLKGNSVKTRVIWIMNDLPVLAEATLTNIVPTGGAANAKQTFSFTISFNGRPKIFNGQLTLAESDQKTVYTATVDSSVKAGDDGQPPKAIVKDAGDTDTTAAGGASNSSNNA